MSNEELGKYYIAMHREMWTWLSENPKKNKQDWPGWDEYGYDFSPKMVSHCFLCAHNDKFGDSCCSFCPLSWGITDMCMDKFPEESYYNKYYDADSPEERTRYAIVIANLPLKGDIRKE